MPHSTYLELADSLVGRTAVYRELFKGHIDDKTLAQIRETTQKGWVLSSDYFFDKIEARITTPARKRGSGGDRRSKQFRDKRSFK